MVAPGFFILAFNPQKSLLAFGPGFPEEREEGHKVFKWGKWFHRKGAERAGLLGASRGRGAWLEEVGGWRVHSGGRRGAWPVGRKCTCSQGQEAGGHQMEAGLEPQEQEVSEEQWPGSFSCQTHTSGLAATFKDLKIWKQALGKGSN